ncbi:MAG: cupin domain-containing protein [bacterium]
MKKTKGGNVMDLEGAIKYESGAIVSKTLIEKKDSDLSLFAFDKGQGMSAHTSPYDAVVQVLDGEASIVIGRKPVKVKAGQLVIMPSKVPHSLTANKRFKMLLTLVK